MAIHTEADRSAEAEPSLTPADVERRTRTLLAAHSEAAWAAAMEALRPALVVYLQTELEAITEPTMGPDVAVDYVLGTEHGIDAAEARRHRWMSTCRSFAQAQVDQAITTSRDHAEAF